jgi:hypothetical protein
MSWQRAKELMHSFRSASIQAAPEGIMGLHATTYRLHVECGFNSASFTWWYELPPQWTGLSAVVAHLEAIAHESVKRNAA